LSERGRRCHDALLLVAALIAVLLALDRLSGLSASAPGPSPAPHGRGHAGFSRTFVLIPDSMRYQTAMDASIMPHLAEMRRRGISARVETVFEGYSEPAFRAMFSGTEQPRILNVVGNFYDVGLKVPSLFDEVWADGLSAADYAGPHLLQFDHLLRRHFWAAPGESVEAWDERLVGAAERAFLDERIDLVVAHLDSTDWVAHEYGVRAPRYRAVYHRVDGLIAKLDAELPPDVTLLVSGDHGHDESGAHKTGLDIPTELVARGPGFLPGVDLGTIRITDIRYLLSWALKLPVEALGYDRAVLCRGLRDPASFPGFAPTADPPRRPRPAFPFLTVAAVCLLAALAWMIPIVDSAQARICGWLAVLALAAGYEGLAVVPPAVALFPRRMAVLAAPLALVGWGMLISSTTLTLPPAVVSYGWILPVALAIPLGRTRRTTAIWAIAAVLSLLIEPALQRLGLPRQSTEIWIFLVWLALLPRPVLTRRFWTVLAIVVVLLRLLSSADRNGVAAPLGMGEMAPLAALALGAKLWLFSRFARTRRDLAAALALTLALAGVQWILWPKIVGIDAKWTDAALAAILLVARFTVGRRGPLKGMLELALLFLAYYDFVDNRTYQYAWMDCILAAFTAAAPWAEEAADRALLLAVGLLLTYHVTVVWCVGGLEWHALYRWFPARVVEDHVAFFVPWILLKTLLPFWLAARLLAQVWGGLDDPTLGWLRLAASARACAFMALTCGLAVAQDGAAYLMFAESAAVCVVLYLGTAALRASKREGRG
jgi:hypothetical protein